MITSLLQVPYINYGMDDTTENDNLSVKFNLMFVSSIL